MKMPTPARKAIQAISKSGLAISIMEKFHSKPMGDDNVHMIILEHLRQINERVSGVESNTSLLFAESKSDTDLQNAIHNLNNKIDTVLNQVNYTNHNLYLHLAEAVRKRDLYYRDIMLAVNKVAEIYPSAHIDFHSDVPVAADTDDHKFPWGAGHDNTRLPRLVLAAERMFERDLTFLDLGCSGGGLVLDFILRGHRAYGIEGSNHPQQALRAEWRVLPNNLMTGDITKPFYLNEKSGEPVLCDVISMWEVLEHIAEDDLPQLFENVKRHLKPDGVFVGSVCHVPDDHPNGAQYHRTVRPMDWWIERFSEYKLPITSKHNFQFADFARGTSNGPLDGNYMDDPGVGSHFVARRSAD